MGRFKKGLMLGGLIGGVLTWLNISPKGKEYRDKMFESVESLYDELRMSIQKLEGPTRDMYDALVERAVEEYATKKEVAMEMKNDLIKELKKRWENLEEEIRNR
jgi:gas vesicle protein